MPIKLLDKEIISQIAAGEVVERPASVVKELVENALDAGSRQITVEVKGGGTSLIRVIDDGCGIPAGEAGLLFKRHATSKIGSLADLQSIATLGFRGEALASIAAVAEVEIVTCADGEAGGTCIKLDNGADASRQEQGRARGTTVSVRNLFRRVPARLKFLKSASTENSHIAEVVSQYALVFPEVRFTLVIEGKSSFETPGQGQLIGSVIAVYGADVAGHMLEIGGPGVGWESGQGGIEVSGMVGSPQVGRSSRGYLSFFVNRRWITSRALGRAVEEAYSGLLMTGRHPIAVINITLPPGVVDVNIHPAKSEVRFQDERAAFAAVQRAVRQALVAQMPVPRIEEVARPFVSPARPVPRGPELWPSRAEVMMTPPEPAQPLVRYLPVLRIMGQVAACYIVAEGPEGLYLIDQHAAHERILFDKVKQSRSQRGVAVQSLLEPATFEVSPGQDAVLKRHYTSLAEFGFMVEPFGERAYLVRGVPNLLNGKDWAAVLRELLDAASGGDKSDWGDRVAESIACHGAVRRGQKLSDDEMRELIRQLEAVANPNTCPHGRPTMIHLSLKQLEREFGRS